MSALAQRYNVGGVLLPRPFKLRRLGHFGFNVADIETSREFYGDLIGFTASDKADFSRAPWFPKDAGLGETHGYFMRHGTDHHALVLFSKPVMDHRADRKFASGVTINQITWQCGSLKEIADAHSYFEEQQIRIQRVGPRHAGQQLARLCLRPGRPHHRALLRHRPDRLEPRQQAARHVLSRVWARSRRCRRCRRRPNSPRRVRKGIDIFSGHRPNGNLSETYDVEGVLLARPFKVTKIGPVRLFVEDVGRAEDFYVRHLGFVKSEETRYRGARCVFLRCGAEHHSLALYPRELRSVLGLSEHTSCMSLGLEVASYAQLREAIAFLKSRGVSFIDTVPPELYPGIDYAAFALDPDGHLIQLYYYMEQIGWDGRVRPAGKRRRVDGAWPEALEPLSDTYVDQVFQGPLG